MRVERAGSATGGYGRGWVARTDGSILTAVGQHFESWTDAMEYALGGPLVSEATA